MCKGRFILNGDVNIEVKNIVGLLHGSIYIIHLGYLSLALKFIMSEK
jgi:hypothetical protein